MIIEQWEISPSFLCGNDCLGCPDRASFYLQHLKNGGQPEKKRSLAWWNRKIEQIEKMGGRYGLLIGGELTTAFAGLAFLLKKMAGMERLDAGLFTDGISSYNRRINGPSEKFKELVKNDRLLETTIHLSVDYLIKTPPGRRLPDLSLRQKNSRQFKSSYGLWLAKLLVNLGAKRVVVNTTIKADNIDEVIPIYQYCEELQKLAKGKTAVLFTFSPWQHHSHLCRGDDPLNYPRSAWLDFNHYHKLQRISDFLLKETWQRIHQQKPRVAANSSGYLAAVSSWITQNVGCYQEPEIRAVIPDGTTRLCPIMKTKKQILTCWGCSYGGITDRIILNNRWTPTWLGEENKDYFLNLIQSTKRNYPYWK